MAQNNGAQPVFGQAGSNVPAFGGGGAQFSSGAGFARGAQHAFGANAQPGFVGNNQNHQNTSMNYKKNHGQSKFGQGNRSDNNNQVPAFGGTFQQSNSNNQANGQIAAFPPTNKKGGNKGGAQGGVSFLNYGSGGTSAPAFGGGSRQASQQNTGAGNQAQAAFTSSQGAFGGQRGFQGSSSSFLSNSAQFVQQSNQNNANQMQQQAAFNSRPGNTTSNIGFNAQQHSFQPSNNDQIIRNQIPQGASSGMSNFQQFPQSTQIGHPSPYIPSGQFGGGQQNSNQFRPNFLQQNRNCNQNKSKYQCKDLDCPICQEVMTEPCTLPCNHRVCLPCFKQMLKTFMQQRRI